jgi:hypothetical protein
VPVPVAEGVTLEAFVEAAVRGALKAFDSRPANAQPTSLTVSLFTIVLAPPAKDTKATDGR